MKPTLLLTFLLLFSRHHCPCYFFFLFFFLYIDVLLPFLFPHLDDVHLVPMSVLHWVVISWGAK